MDGIFEETADGLWIWDGRGCLIAINAQAERYGGVQERAILGKNHAHLIADGLYDRSAVPDILALKESIAVPARSIRTGVRTLNSGFPFISTDGEIVRIVVKERRVDARVNGQLSPLHRTDWAQSQPNADDLTLPDLDGESIIAESENYRHVLRMAIKLARAGVSDILLLGETGTGKGLLARMIHCVGSPPEAPFVTINCAAIPQDLLEAELFGYEPGAFTGAREDGKAGLLELAHGGTLFLDEIGDLPLNLQAKLLKFLDDFKVTRLGGTQSKRIRCMVICATNRDPQELVRQGKFRPDLLYRINAFNLTIPPLCERPEDLMSLVRHMLAKYNHRYRQNRCISNGSLARLRHYPFPGNVRELKNIVKRAVVLSETDMVDDTIATLIGAFPSATYRHGLKERMRAYERRVLVEALTRHRTTRSIGTYLGINQSNVVRKLRKHGLKLPLK